MMTSPIVLCIARVGDRVRSAQDCMLRMQPRGQGRYGETAVEERSATEQREEATAPIIVPLG